MGSTPGGIAGDVVCGYFFFFQAEDGIRDLYVTGVQTCALPIYSTDCRRRDRRACQAGAARETPRRPVRARSSFACSLVRLADERARTNTSSSRQIGRASCRERVQTSVRAVCVKE